MTARARAKQTATATGQYAFNLAGGAAATGMLTFEQAFQFPTSASLSGPVYWYDVTALVEVTSGPEAGKWALMTGTVMCDNTGAKTFTSNAARCIQTSAFNAGTREFDALAIANGNTVTLTVVPPGLELVSVRGRNRVSDELAGMDDGINGWTDDGTVEPVFRAPDALLAVGKGARAGMLPSYPAKHAVAIGDGSANALADAAYALGYGANPGAFGGVVGGHKVPTSRPCELGGGMANVKLLQAAAQPVTVNTTHGRGTMERATSDATPTRLRSHNPLTHTAGVDDPALSWSDNIYCDVGTTIVEARLSAVHVASGDTKVWRLNFAASTLLGYGATQLVGAVDKVVVGTVGAGTGAWDVSVTANSSNDCCYIDVTGEAGKDIVWQLTYDVGYHTVYR